MPTVTGSGVTSTISSGHTSSGYIVTSEATLIIAAGGTPKKWQRAPDDVLPTVGA